MKKFEFKLETVLKVKIRIEDQRKKELRVAELQCEAAQKQLNSRKLKADEVVRYYQQSLNGQLDPFIANNYNHYLTWLNKLVEQDRFFYNQCEAAVAVARGRLLEATKEKKIIEKLKEQAYQEYKTAELKAEIKFLDELGTNRFVRQ